MDFLVLVGASVVVDVVVVVVGFAVDNTLTINGGSVTTWTGIITSRGFCGLMYFESSR